MRLIKKSFQIIIIFLMFALFIRGMIFLFGNAQEKQFVISGDYVAVLKFEGVISSSEKVIETFKELELNKNVKGYILRVDSPGGGVTPSQEIYKYLLTLKKPLYVAMESYAASGGYMISLPAKKIYAMESTTTGSIGVIMMFNNYAKLASSIGIDQVVIKSGKYKDIGNQLREFTEDDREILDEYLQDLYMQFVGYVKEHRKYSQEQAVELSDGRIFTGNQAQKIGLVDEIGSWMDAFDAMKVELDNDKIPYYFVKFKEKNILESYLSKIKLDETLGMYSKKGAFYLHDF